MNLSGSICALATPFRAADDALDLDAFDRLIDYQLCGGTRGLVVAGSTGEGAALDNDEFRLLVERAVRRVAGKVPVLAGTGLQSTRKTIAQTRLAAAAGADIALVVTPAYVRPTHEGLYRHFSEIAEHGQIPLMLYNVPSRTACDLHVEIVARLASHPMIAGIKEARADAERMHELLVLGSPEFRIFSGDDPTCARAMLAGADGVISVAANVAPAAMQDLAERARSGDAATTGPAEDRLRELYEFLGVESNPIPVKWLLQRLGLGGENLRLPLLTLSPAYHAQAEHVLVTLGLSRTAPSAR